MIEEDGKSMNIRNIIKRVIYFSRDSIDGISGLRFLRKNKGKDEKLLVLTDLIGDSVYGLSYVEEIKKKYSDKRIVVIGNEKYSKLIRSYNGIDRFVLLPGRQGRYLKIGAFLRCTWLSYIALKEDIINTDPYLYKDLRKKTNNDAFYLLKTQIFHIPEDSKISYHGIGSNTAQTVHDKKVAVINPYSISVKIIDFAIFELIAKVLRENNYKVYTNVVGNQEVIAGTEKLECDIYKLFDIASNSSLIVSARSGILDFLAPSGINMFIIYANTTREFYEMYHIDKWRCGGKYKEYFVENKIDKDDIMSEFIKFMKTNQ